MKTFQEQVTDWGVECFGAKEMRDKLKRNHRFLEEALELVQACGATKEDAHKLVDYVYDRPEGDPGQEVGGVMVTLAALCAANEIDVEEAGWVELARVWGNIAKIQAKEAVKPQNSPLPGNINSH